MKTSLSLRTRALLRGAIALLCFCSGGSAQAGFHQSRIETAPGIRLRYVLAKPTFKRPPRAGFPVWIFQSGDGRDHEGYSSLLAILASTWLAEKYGVIFVFPELRREALHKDPVRYCELDFRHRVTDLNAIIDRIKSDPHADPDRIFLIGGSGGAEAVTMTMATRQDLAGVATISGSLVEWGTYLSRMEPDALELKIRHNQCHEGTYYDRSEAFWSQMLDSNLTERIRCAQVPYLAIEGSRDGGGKVVELDREVLPCLKRENPTLRYEVVEGMGHSFWLDPSPFDKISRWSKSLRHSTEGANTPLHSCGALEDHFSYCGPAR